MAYARFFSYSRFIGLVESSTSESSGSVDNGRTGFSVAEFTAKIQQGCPWRCNGGDSGNAVRSLEQKLTSKIEELAVAEAAAAVVVKAVPVPDPVPQQESRVSVAEEMQKAPLFVESTLVTAREVLSDEVERIISEANVWAEETLAVAQRESERLTREAILVKQAKERRTKEYRSLLAAHLSDTPDPSRD